MAKIMISIPDDLLTAVDTEAKARGASRSALLQEAARREVVRPDAAAVDEAIARARAALADAPAWDSTAAIRADRDSR